MTVAQGNIIGSAYVAILPDTSKTAAQTVTGLSAAGVAGGKALATGIASGTTAGGAAVSKFTQTLQSSFGGALGPLDEIQGKFEGLVETIKHEGPLSAAGLAGIGTAAVGAGVALQAIGSADASSMAQLKAAINATGQSADDYEGKIEELTKQNEQYGIRASQTNTALQSLINITGDANTATGLMSLTVNLAASRHTSLASAAQQVGRAAEGNTRLFKLYGIQVQTNADGTKNIQGALDQLSQKLNGQAAASVDSFTGHLKVLGTEVEDQVASFGQKYGPAITALGAGVGLLGGVVQLGSKGVDALRGSVEAATTATLDDVAATAQSVAGELTEQGVVAQGTALETALTGATTAAATATEVQGTTSETAAGQLTLFAASETAVGDAAVVATGELTAMKGAQIEAAAAADAGGFASTLGALGSLGALGLAAGVAIGGTALIVHDFYKAAEADAKEGKAAADDFWKSLTGGSQDKNDPKVLQGELDSTSKKIGELSTQLAAAKVQYNALAPNINGNALYLEGEGHSVDDTTDKYVALGNQIDVTSAEIKRLTGDQKGLQATTTTISSNIKQLSTDLGINTDQVLALANANQIDLSGAEDALYTRMLALTGQTADQVTQMSALESQYGVSADQITAFAKAQSLTLTGTADQTTAFEGAVTVMQETGSYAQQLSSDQQKLASDFSSVTDKATAFKGILDDLMGTSLSYAQANDEVQQKVNDLGKALSTNSHTLDGASDSAINNRKAIEDIVTAATNAATAMYKQSGSVDEANATYDIYYSKIVAAAKANGINQGSLTDLLSSFNALPAQVAAGLGATAGIGTNAGTATVSAMSAALQSKASIEQVTAAASELPDAVNKSLPTDMYNLGNTAGDSLIGGYVVGITKNLSRATEASEQVPAAARYALQSNSPSKVMMSIGDDAATGLAIGLNRSIPMLKSSTLNIVNEIVGGAAAAAGNVAATAHSAAIQAGGLTIAQAAAKHAATIGLGGAAQAGGLTIAQAAGKAGKPGAIPGSVMPKGGGVQVNGYWYTEAQLAALSNDGTPSGGIQAAISAHPAAGALLGAGSSGPAPVAVVSGGIAPSDLTPLLNVLNEIAKAMTAELAATKQISQTIESTAGAELAALSREYSAGKAKG